mgnify:CR=1 FL=1
MVVATADVTATTRTTEDVVVEIGISNTKLKLKVPVLAEDEGIAVCHTRTCGPTLIAAIRELTEVSTKEADVILDTSEVILSTKDMEADEVTRKVLIAQYFFVSLCYNLNFVLW